MLSQLSVKNFAIADHVEVVFDSGMTVLSGETGAGKSIILDALGLALGDRADTSMVRHGESKAEISAVFDISSHQEAKAWLEAHDLETNDECVLRRVITAEGRSRSYINGQPCPLQSLKTIGEHLIDIHSQHEHQSLLLKENHRKILDEYAQLSELSTSVTQAYQQWAEKDQRLAELESNQDELDARLQLLQFQVDELDKLGLQEGEVELLEKEQHTLANAEQILSKAFEAIALCEESDTNAGSMVSAACHALQAVSNDNEHITEALNMLSEASIQISEASSTLRHFTDSFELNPERLSWVEERLSAVYQLARKHRCEANELAEVHFKLNQEVQQYLNGDQNLEQLEKEVAALAKQYQELAEQQRKERSKHAKILEQKIAEQLHLMDMKSVKLVVAIKPLDKNSFSQHGLDSIELLISTNPGQPPKALSKVASGGELSRVSLAIQVVIAQSSTIPTLVFDEVDVGIGGGTAQIVGRLLRSLGEQGQVICVTHLPQVASQGHQHFFISKKVENESVKSRIDRLSENDRTQEIARMLGGVEITQQTLAHAKEMLETN